MAARAGAMIGIHVAEVFYVTNNYVIFVKYINNYEAIYILSVYSVLS